MRAEGGDQQFTIQIDLWHTYLTDWKAPHFLCCCILNRPLLFSYESLFVRSLLHTGASIIYHWVQLHSHRIGTTLANETLNQPTDEQWMFILCKLGSHYRWWWWWCAVANNTGIRTCATKCCRWYGTLDLAAIHLFWVTIWGFNGIHWVMNK